jgi:hypothetical protein
MIRGIFQVPVIALFTKYDQFKRNIRMKLEDEYRDHPETAEKHVDVEIKRVFEQQYLAGLSHGRPAPYIHMESEDFIADELIIC